MYKEIITKRPKPESSTNFEEDICALLIHHKFVGKKALIQNVKIFLGVDNLPFVEIKQFINSNQDVESEEYGKSK